MHRAHHTILLHDCSSFCCLKIMSAAINSNFVLFIIVLSGICVFMTCVFLLIHVFHYMNPACIPQSTSCLCLLLLSLPYVNE